jgi:hypothetical protein
MSLARIKFGHAANFSNPFMLSQRAWRSLQVPQAPVEGRRGGCVKYAKIPTIKPTIDQARIPTAAPIARNDATYTIVISTGSIVMLLERGLKSTHLQYGHQHWV